MNLIDKDTLVAEIDKRLDELWDLLPNASDVIKDNYTKQEANITGKYTALESFENFINTLEVKEVDLEKVFLDEYSKFSNDVDAMDYAFPIDLADYKDFAKHFFELGLNYIKSNKNE